MRFLVNGSSGFVGGALVQLLSEQGHEGMAVSRKGLSRVPENWEEKRREEVLRKGRNFPLNIDVLVHLEVLHHVEKPSSFDDQLFRSVNVDGLQDWLDWCDKHSVAKIIYFSSIKAVQGAGHALGEEADGPGESAYGVSKWQAERLVREWAEDGRGRSALILRPAVIYGPGNTANIYSFVSAIHRGRFVLVGGSLNIKSIVSLKNVVNAVSYLSERMTIGVQTYNLVDRENYSLAALASLISEALGKRGRIYSIPVFLAKILAYCGDFLESVFCWKAPLTTARLKALLEHTEFSCRRLVETGFKHKQSTQVGLQELVRWYVDEVGDGGSLENVERRG